ncbi:MAG: hypothetical protein E7633_02190 [Ruminococcaceae bacterium]|nr:hypothetical protein [Oscillospiraceae bacterium]
MAETSQNTKNIHRHNPSGIIFASVILLCIVIVSLIITFTALGNDEPPVKDPDTDESGNKDENKNPDNNQDPDNNKDPNGNENQDPGGNENQNHPSGNQTVTVESDKIFSGPLILLGEASPYNRPVEELITRSAMGNLAANKVLSDYNFINLSSGHTGDFILKDRNLFLDVETAEAFRKMMAAYATETGHKNIWLRNAYYYDSSEDIKTTEDINEALLNPHAAGLAVDLQISTANGQIPLKNAYTGYPSAEYYDWFVTNCHKYGFIHTGNTTNYSTFRYVGVAHATYMAKNGISLDEYLNTIKANTAQERLVISDDFGKEWWVYYVYASEDSDSTDITVFGELYSISGNNTDGFVVTIDTSGL